MSVTFEKLTVMLGAAGLSRIMFPIWRFRTILPGTTTFANTTLEQEVLMVEFETGSVPLNMLQLRSPLLSQTTSSDITSVIASLDGLTRWPRKAERQGSISHTQRELHLGVCAGIDMDEECFCSKHLRNESQKKLSTQAEDEHFPVTSSLIDMIDAIPLFLALHVSRNLTVHHRLKGAGRLCLSL